RSPEVYLDIMLRHGLDSNALSRCVRILDCYSDPLGWKQNIRSEQHQEDSGTPCSTNKDTITIFRSVKDVDKLSCSIIDLGRGFEGEGKTYFSVAVDSVCILMETFFLLWKAYLGQILIQYQISSMLRHASVQSISGLLSNLRSHDQISSIFWLMHSDLHETKFSRAFECLSTMVACVEPEVVDSVYGEERRGDMSFLEHNYSKAKFHVRLKRRNGRVKHLYEELCVEGYDVKFISATSVSIEVNQSLLPKVQFNLELSEKERSDRANVVLPFEHQGKGEPIRIYDGRRSLPEAHQDPNLTTAALLDETEALKSANPKGEIHYLRDSDDERPDSDEDPDDDLDI
uniref:Elongator complex protein 5 n=1 Tax=Aegilops tauschii subsp. strangulata TaxID=200361 RepID=A0A453IQS9_AEGTS